MDIDTSIISTLILPILRIIVPVMIIVLFVNAVRAGFFNHDREPEPLIERMWFLCIILILLWVLPGIGY